MGSGVVERFISGRGVVERFISESGVVGELQYQGMGYRDSYQGAGWLEGFSTREWGIEVHIRDLGGWGASVSGSGV